MKNAFWDFRSWNFKIICLLWLSTVGILATAVILLLGSISLRKGATAETAVKVVELDEDTIDPVEWGKNFPRQYDTYKRTVDIERTRYGGSEAFDKLERDPRWRELFKGYSFAVDYREERGHAYMLSDQETTLRVQKFDQPGACLHCHSSVIPAYREMGRKSGITDNQPLDQIMKGFEVVCAMPYTEARKLVKHPVACIDCHDPRTMRLRVTRPGFINAIKMLARSEDKLEHLSSIERWRKGDRREDYDVNAEASRQEMRAFACGQCHAEYYFKEPGKLLVYPWHNGLKVEQIEKYYDETGFKDWTHLDTGAAVLKAQHPEFEMWNQGIHARSGVVCADCHMPYKREGAIKISDHHVRSPLLNISRACRSCHHYSEAEIKSRVEDIQDKTRALLNRAEDALIDFIKETAKVRAGGASDEALKSMRDFYRKAQWRLDFVAAENSMGFHAPQEAARILAEAIDYARQGEKYALSLQIEQSVTAQKTEKK